MTHFFQPLDLTVNGSAKQFMRKKFITFYSDAVKSKLDRGERIEDRNRSPSDYIKTSSCPVAAVDMYNFFTSTKGVAIIARGWRKAGIAGLLDGTISIPYEDPCETLYSSSKIILLHKSCIIICLK